jgi:hypothetical protein
LRGDDDVPAIGVGLASELGDKLEIYHVVEHQEPVRLGIEPRFDRLKYQLLLLRGRLRKLEQGSEAGEVGVQRLVAFRAHPEYGRVLVAMKVAVAGGGLRLAHTAHSGEGEDAALLQSFFDLGQLVAALGEERVVGKGNREKRARHPPLKFRQLWLGGCVGSCCNAWGDRTFLGWQNPNRGGNWRWPSSRLLGDSTQEVFVTGVGAWVVVCSALQLDGNKRLVVLVEKNRDELGVLALGIVKLLGDYHSFPSTAATLSQFFLSLVSPKVGFGAGDQHEIRFLNLLGTPARPAFCWGLFVLVDAAVDAVTAQPLGEVPDAVHVRGRVVAVADQDAWHRWRHDTRCCCGKASS